MKDLVTKKRCLDFETIEFSYNCGAIVTNTSVAKKEDLGAFTIPCTIDFYEFSKALCDCVESINLTPYAIYKKLGLGVLKPTTVRLLMADWSIK
ncbi:unnamed protein product [Withania somnifera]